MPLPQPAIREDGLVSGYASLFHTPDLHGDVVRPGAFRATLARKSPRDIKFLLQHEPKDPIGVWLDMFEDTRGLRVIGKMLRGICRARDAYALLRAGALDGLSIGFKPEKARRTAQRRDLLSIDLWEISLVTFPMLPGARLAALDA